jgi:hypothetical protein
MGLVVRLPDIIAKLARAFRDISIGCLAWFAMLSEAQAPQAPQEIVLRPPVLSQEQEALVAEFQQHMATVFQVQMFERDLLRVLRFDGL